MKGRLWVVETPEYPNGRTINANDAPVKPWRNGGPEEFRPGTKEDRPARDRVSILEDTNGDGIMDKKTVFADGLELATSMVFYKDGVIVSQAPDILWIRDTDGDGKADKTEVLFTGWEQRTLTPSSATSAGGRMAGSTVRSATRPAGFIR